MMPKGHRIVPALLTGLVWAISAALTAGVSAAALTTTPATAPDGGGGVIHLKGDHGPSWPAVLTAGTVMGVAAGLAGTAWRYTRPE